MNHGGTKEILLVEDKPAAVRLIQEVLKENRSRNRLHVASDGWEALAFLRREAQYVDVPRPDLILLDLNLPGKDGREVLGEIKRDDELKRIPVVVLTVSQSEDDIRQTYDLYGNCYVAKPIHLDAFVKAVKSIEDFWLNTVTLPPE
jgi:chemotaxis family two-component system response regulator Rcp1